MQSIAMNAQFFSLLSFRLMAKQWQACVSAHFYPLSPSEWDNAKMSLQL
jgi:hypothetical protein